MRRTITVMSTLLVVTGLAHCDRDRPERRITQAATSSHDDTQERGRARAELVRQGLVVPPPEKGAGDQNPRELLLACVERKGGREKVEAVKTVRTRGKSTGAENREFEVVFALPDKLLVNHFSNGKQSQGVIVTGREGWSLTPEKVTKLESSQVDDVRLSLRADVTVLLQHALRDDTQLTYLGRSEVVGRKTQVIQVSIADSPDVKLHIDAETRDPLAVQFTLSKQGPVLVVESDYRDVDGLRVAHESKMVIDTSITLTKLESVTINPPLPPETFLPSKHPFWRDEAATPPSP